LHRKIYVLLIGGITHYSSHGEVYKSSGNDTSLCSTNGGINSRESDLNVESIGTVVVVMLLLMK
ncbi:hypothetical protein, partial [Pectobacterium quasiaquaticum]|uniref:hypothetical protein n=1 Tax=Pectobacterium quasiaquaticum TaxID=2774015 RepID=UPI001CF7D29F